MKNIHPHLLASLNDFVESRMGMHFPPARLGDLERGICAAAAEFGFSQVESCIDWLLSSVVSQSQIETLASHLTVGETHFFRDKRVFEILETHVLPGIINARRGRAQNLRIWSAACSSGEEPYSVAILLARMLPDLQDWNISILATDIAPPALKKATAGVYREWSFRDTPGWVKERYFKKIQRTFEISPDIKRMVTFSCLNLAEDSYPAMINSTNAMDIVFCRNVLMYFSRNRAHAVLENLSRCLVDGGWLVVSPVDAPGPVFPALLQPVRFPGAMLFQKGSRPEDDGRRSATMPEQPAPVRHTAVAGTVGKTREAVRSGRRNAVTEAPEQSVVESGEVAKQARQLADRGRLADALVLCEEAIKYDKLNPTLPYLQATILQEMGRAEEAAAALQRALYIDQEFVIAHFALGHLLQRQGRYAEAGKHLRKALALLSACENGDIPPEAEGMSAGRLIELINAMQGGEGQGE